MVEGGWERRRRRVAHEIETVALGCFARDGYHAVTVEQIAAAAEIHERTFFRYFSTKEEVMLALPRRSVDAVCAAFGDRPPDEPLLEAFASGVAAAAHALHDDADLRTISGEIFLNTPELGPRAFGEFSLQMSSAVGSVVATRLGEPPHTVRVGVVTAILTGVLVHVWTRWLLGGGVDDITTALRQALRIVELTALDGWKETESELDRLRAEVEELTIERESFKRATATPLDQAP